jgi:hypothetical protein
VKVVVSQISAVAKPASAVGPSVIVNDFVSTAMPQLPLPVTVRVNVTTFPISPATGVYVGVRVIASAAVMVPDPL